MACTPGRACRQPAAGTCRGWKLRAALVFNLLGFGATWSEAGHDRIARIAELLLKGKHKDQVRTMLHADLVDLAGWEQKVTSKQPSTARLHWHRQSPEWTCDQGIGLKGKLRCNEAEAAYDSILCAASTLFRKYAHDAYLRDFPRSKEPLWESDTQYLEILKRYAKEHDFCKVVASNATELRWMATLLGDMHQPLHMLAEHDYGRNVKVIYKGQEHTLLSFWEDFIPQHLPAMAPQAELDKLFGDMSKSLAGIVPTDLFRDWARESAELACKGIYAGMSRNHANGTTTFEHEVSDQMFEGWLKLAEEVTARGGVRLALVLLDLIEHRKHALASKDGRGRRHKFTRYRRNLGINLGIAIVVVPGLLVLFRLHARVGSPTFTGLVLKHLKL